MPSIEAHDGKAWLVDIDPGGFRNRGPNVEHFGWKETVEVVNADAIAFADEIDDEFDLLVVDAETAEDFPDPESGARRSMDPSHAPGYPNSPLAAVSFSTIYPLSAFSGVGIFFDERIRRNRSELEPLLSLLAAETESFLKCRVPKEWGLEGALPQKIVHRIEFGSAFL